METEKKEVKKTNKKQFDVMMKEMEANVDIARGICKFGSSRAQVDVFWEDLSKSLNILGPPLRTTKEWKKVWADFKRNTKQKLSYNKKEKKATGGGENTEIVLTPSEKLLDDILNLTDATIPDGEIFGIPQSPEPSTSATTPRIIKQKQKPIRKKTQKNQRLIFLKKQTATQSDIYSAAKKKGKNTLRHKAFNKCIG